MTAALYALRAGKSVMLLEKSAFGGQIAESPLVENIPSIASISGQEYAYRLFDQISNLGVGFDMDNVTGIVKNDGYFTAQGEYGSYEARAVVIATGCRPRKLAIPGEEKFLGKGVSYCATCDGPFFKGGRVAVVGGGDTALTDALYLSKLCSDVYIIHRRTEFRGQKMLEDRVRAKENIHLELGKNVISINGDGKKVTSVTLSDSTELSVDGVFIFVGMEPNSRMLEGFADLDHGFVSSDDHMRTSVPGLFVAGDVRTTPFRQVVTAAGDGAMAAHAADEYIQGI